MKTSVAMCTYNGEAYIEEQLNSILNQSIKVDEIIIHDDCSSDKTMKILKRYEKKYPSKIVVKSNQTRLGFVKNFENAVLHCRNDIIFLSDQDDIWEYSKVEKILSIFESRSDVHYIFSDGKIIDANGKPLGKTLWQMAGFSTSKKNFFNKRSDQYRLIAKKPFVTGATLAFRSSCVKKCVPFSSAVPHDWWISLIMSFSIPGCGMAYNEPLIYYRIHKNQSIGFKKKHAHLLSNTKLLNNSTEVSTQQIFLEMYKDILDLKLNIPYKEKQFITSAKNYFQDQISISRKNFIKRLAFFLTNLRKIKKFRGIFRSAKDIFWR